jgi:2-keto-4-pentenoate hydratase
LSDIAASAEAIASRLAAEHAERRPFAVVPELSGDLALAYAAQNALLARWQAEGLGDIVGWKIGLTTPHMQAMAGIDQPIAGAILSTRAYPSGAQLAAADYLRLGVECEITLRLGRPLPLGEPYDADRVLACLDAACVAFELIEDRNADYRALEAATMIADNSWNAGVVLGPPCPTSEFETLLGLEGRLFVDGELLDRGMSDSVGGNPLSVVDWIARALAARGRALEPGQWVMTGSVVTTKFAKAGQSFRFEMDRLGAVEMAVA